MKSISLKVVIGLGVSALLAALALIVWAGFAMSAHGG